MRTLRHLFVVLLLVCAVPPSFIAAAPHVHAEQDPETITVYVTRTGAKYHRDGCRYLSRSKIAMSLKEAAKRFEPCKVCRPPVAK
jgi:hypothetical protein